MKNLWDENVWDEKRELKLRMILKKRKGSCQNINSISLCMKELSLLLNIDQFSRFSGFFLFMCENLCNQATVCCQKMLP